MAKGTCGHVFLVALLGITVVVLGVGIGTPYWLWFTFTDSSTFSTSLWYHVLCPRGGTRCQAVSHPNLDSALSSLNKTEYTLQVQYVQKKLEDDPKWLEWGIEASIAWAMCFVSMVTGCHGFRVKSKTRQSYGCITASLVFCFVAGTMACIAAAMSVKTYLIISKRFQDEADIGLQTPWSMWVFLVGAILALFCGVVLFLILCGKLVGSKRRNIDVLNVRRPIFRDESNRRKKRKIFIIPDKPVPRPEPIIQTVVVKERVPVPVPYAINASPKQEVRYQREPRPMPPVAMPPNAFGEPVYTEAKKKRSSKKRTSGQELVHRSSDDSRKSSAKSHDVVDNFAPDIDDYYFRNGGINSQLKQSRGEHLNFHPEQSSPKFGVLDFQNDMYIRRKSSRKKENDNNLRRSGPAEFERKRSDRDRDRVRRTTSLRPVDRDTDQRKLKSSASDPDLLDGKPKKRHREFTEAKHLEKVDPTRELNLSKNEDKMSDVRAFIRSKEERDVDEIYFTGSILRG